jgi:hypothetical protein
VQFVAPPRRTILTFALPAKIRHILRNFWNFNHIKVEHGSKTQGFIRKRQKTNRLRAIGTPACLAETG